MLKPRLLAFALAGTALAVTSCAQAPHAGHGGAHAGHAHGPYAGLQKRTIKALSDEQLADLRAGRGMSLALAAELNGYPGPLHVLELADPLQLTEGQRARTRALFERMQREARVAGEEVIAAETALDELFAKREVDAASLARGTARAAAALGRLRETHLRYHLGMVEVLSPEQVARYVRLRGY